MDLDSYSFCLTYIRLCMYTTGARALATKCRHAEESGARLTWPQHQQKPTMGSSGGKKQQQGGGGGEAQKRDALRAKCWTALQEAFEKGLGRLLVASSSPSSGGGGGGSEGAWCGVVWCACIFQTSMRLTAHKSLPKQPQKTAEVSAAVGPQAGVNRPLLCRILAWELEQELNALFLVGGDAEGYRKKAASLRVRVIVIILCVVIHIRLHRCGCGLFCFVCVGLYIHIYLCVCVCGG